MPTYRYKAVTREGQPTNGVITCESQEEATIRLTNRGFQQISVIEAKLPKRHEASDVAYTRRTPVGLVLLIILIMLGGLGFLAYEMGWIPEDLLQSIGIGEHDESQPPSDPLQPDSSDSSQPVNEAPESPEVPTVDTAEPTP